MTTTFKNSASSNDLAALLTGQLVLSKDAAYEQARNQYFW